MHNYILFDKVLQCHLVEDTSKYNLIFKRWKRKFKFNDKYQNYVEEKNKSKDSEQLSSYVQLLLDKEEAKKSKLKEMGIKYEFPGYVS